ncbi:macro domain-containing protein, partial [Pseudomonas aeruginosa]
MAKVNFFDKRVIKKFLEITAVVSGTLSFIVIFVDVPAEWKLKAGLAFLAILALTYVVIWLWSNNLNSIDINVEGSDVAIKTGDIFHQPGLKAIAFNEYFDTQVDN